MAATGALLPALLVVLATGWSGDGGDKGEEEGPTCPLHAVKKAFLCGRRRHNDRVARAGGNNLQHGSSRHAPSHPLLTFGSTACLHTQPSSAEEEYLLGLRWQQHTQHNSRA